LEITYSKQKKKKDTIAVGLKATSRFCEEDGSIIVFDLQGSRWLLLENLMKFSADLILSRILTMCT